MTSVQHTAASSAVVTHYETLRQAALGEALLPEARAGLTLFLQRGMWGWAQGMITRSAVLPPAGERLAPWQPPETDRPLIQLLAALAMQTNNAGDQR